MGGRVSSSQLLPINLIVIKHYEKKGVKKMKIGGNEEMSKFQRLSLRVPKAIHDYLIERSEKTGVSMNGLVILMLENQITQESVAPHIPKMMEVYAKQQKEEQSGL